MSRQADIQKLIVNYTRQLQKLKEQEALLGLSTPPAILLQIEDVETRLAGLQTALQGNRESPATFNFDLEQELAQVKAGEPPQPSPPIGGITITGIQGGTLNIANLVTGTVSGDVIAGDKVGGDKVGRDKISATARESAQANLQAALTEWQREIEAKVTALAELETDEKEELKAKAAKVVEEAAKGTEINANRIERLLNTMSSMAPDIIEITAKILQNPFAGVGLVLEKINDRIKLERQASPK